jgi:nicotinamide-nucleotide amidase
MTTGTLRRFPVASLAVAVTGIAGPDGGSAEKPVGLTYVAAALRDGPALVERQVWPFDRDGNKRASALAALELARRLAVRE